VEELIPIEAIQAAARVYEIAHSCGTCISSDPGKVKTVKLKQIAAALEAYRKGKK
jgi:hypothetical protein